ncbi:hypothetical protein BDZ85DRAFT_267169 [Elsinoe ampelina]|uniref:Uncharacterized protein n=1 Tax=Elsinoe ampelina TaxID=302913 RepID=A0A6A6G2Y7_9PEZI|nr:hypothetical protein BDZ85DRAFT_267169 [Elsinoe ampelina]
MPICPASVGTIAAVLTLTHLSVSYYFDSFLGLSRIPLECVFWFLSTQERGAGRHCRCRTPLKAHGISKRWCQSQRSICYGDSHDW